MSNIYFELLKKPEWQKKRLERLEIAGWECENCGQKDDQLHVHHRQYFKNRSPWEYENEQLEVLCDECHKSSHEITEAIKQILSFSDTREIFNLLMGYCDPKILPKINDIQIEEHNYRLMAAGCFANLITFIDRKKYKSLANFLIENSYDGIRDEAEDFFRKKYDPEWEEM